MNKIIMVVVVVALILGGALWFNGSENKSDDAMLNNSDVMMEKETSDEMVKDEVMTGEKSEDSMMKDDSVMMSKGSYETYSPEKLALADKGDVVLFFRATWCPTCKILDSNLKSNLGTIPPGLFILDVDYDNSSSLKQKYGVTYQHTLVQVDSKGNLITKWSGSSTLADIVSRVK